MKRTIFTGGAVFTGGELRSTEVLAADGRIAAIGAGLDRAGCEVVQLGGNILSPGFIDVHTHGGAGVDINAASYEELCALSRFFAGQGVTGFLASILTDTEEATERAIGNVCRLMEEPAPGAKCIGIHLEGPFLCLKYKGAMPPELLREGDASLFRRYQRKAGGRVRYMTVAPEVPGVLDMLAELRGECVMAIGHSDADYETAREAIRRGVCSCTHTFNVMSLFHQHRPAVMGAVLESDVYCEAICDGRHLHPGTVRMLLKCKGWDKVVAITDSMQAAGLPDGEYMLGVNPVTVTDGDAKITGTDIRGGQHAHARAGGEKNSRLHRRGHRTHTAPAHRKPREAHRRIPPPRRYRRGQGRGLYGPVAGARRTGDLLGGGESLLRRERIKGG